MNTQLKPNQIMLDPALSGANTLNNTQEKLIQQPNLPLAAGSSHHNSYINNNQTNS